ncbi:unnamed protein product [Blepharisma stoltei]|uniref:Selenide, water dikinase n=1 Tax=Blepharisma stoltei TaxID=1481888 RepID=A0AAU9IKL8_9CILI|nr:unnamed protein product [Blepharisma stoltei]
MRRFLPKSLGLNPNFNLTGYADMKGCSCKVPQVKLQEYLRDVGIDMSQMESPDSSIVPVGNGMVLCSTTDFFNPCVADPYLQGQIAACNVLSDLYALGISTCTNMLMVLAVSKLIDENDKKIATSQMMKGFNDMATKAGTTVTGGQSIINPWPIIGGVGMSVVPETQVIYPRGAQPGDMLVLTKPLGCQLAVNLYEWFYYKPHQLEKLTTKPSEEIVNEIFNKACDSMGSLNRKAAELMHKYGSKGATDVTGFGILGHSRNLASVQHADVDIVIHTLPTFAGAIQFDKQVHNYRFIEGFSAETSGGLLVILPRENAQSYIDDFERQEGRQAWIVGEVVPGTKQARVVENPKIINV